MEQQYNLCNTVVIDHCAKADENFLPVKMDSVRLPSPPTDVFDDKKTSVKTYSTLKCLDESHIRVYENHYQDG